jgi:hypothetical protein
MATSKKSRTIRRKQRRTKVSIGGISQSAFAGYAPSSAAQTGQPSAAEKPGNDATAEPKQPREEQARTEKEQD